MVSVKFDQVGHLPGSGDNVAIATRTVEPDTLIEFEGRRLSIDTTVMEGHRFAVRRIAPGEPLLSWSMPFGEATREILPGEYVCNPMILETMRHRSVKARLPDAANFEDRVVPYDLGKVPIRPGRQVAPHATSLTFPGYPRGASRGVGTRNIIVVLGTTSRTASYVRNLVSRVKTRAARCENVDGIVAVAHTEGGSQGRPNNLEMLLRTLAGFLVHPNVGAVLAVDYGSEPVTNRMLYSYMARESYPLADVPHRFLTLTGGFQQSLREGEELIEGWLEALNHTPRSEVSAAHLNVALQCGGSDAFSGVSGNPLAAWVAREIIRYGGSANLAETQELIGAESYILRNVTDQDTAERFLGAIERYRALAEAHGTTAEGNPSGGNRLRGLYNIVLKSIGAGMKRHPDVRLDRVIEYGERMRKPGFYFMDSPGNDLESVAGQVAAGCNVIFFVTGSGAITNFPFVPTLKVVTTTRRYNLLPDEMDVNAGEFLDGRPLDVLGQEMLERTIDIASGDLSKGEIAGHSQVSIWRDWSQREAGNVDRLRAIRLPNGEPISIRAKRPESKIRFRAIRTDRGYATDRVGLVLPSSLCSGQIAQLAAERLNQRRLGRERGISRFVALPHTEGCGFAGESAFRHYTDAMLGHLSHPLVEFGLLLEHGCEMTHNDYWRHQLDERGIDPGRFGWASVQLDGGMERVLDKVEGWFSERIADSGGLDFEDVTLDALRVGLLCDSPLSESASESIGALIGILVGAGGTVVIPENEDLLASPPFANDTLGSVRTAPSLAYGQRVTKPGFHIMESPTKQWVENLTGLGATGVEILLGYAGSHSMQGHPMIPMISISEGATVQSAHGADIDLFLDEDTRQNSEQMLKLIVEAASRRYTPKSRLHGNVDIQFTRGLLGVSM